MTDLPAIPAALVETAARALWGGELAVWATLIEDVRDSYRLDARLALAAALAECEVVQEWAVRVDQPHPKRKEKAGGFIRLADEQIARYGPRIWDGWVPVTRTHCISPWTPASPVDTPREDPRS